jgi:hypothetical protein
MGARRWARARPKTDDRYLPSRQWQDARPIDDLVDGPAVAPEDDAVNPVILLPVLLFAMAVAVFCVGAVLGEAFLLGAAVMLFVVSVFALLAVPLIRMLQDQQRNRMPPR